MEGDTKRLKLVINKNGEPNVVDHTGNIISAEQIAIDWNIGNQVLKLIMQYGKSPAVILKKMELQNRAWYQFIARSQLWRNAFAQKFPEQFNYAIEKPQWWEQVKRKLDDISQKSNREFTYWKRWYEFLSELGRIWVNSNTLTLDSKTLSDIDEPGYTGFLAVKHVDKTQNIVFIFLADKIGKYKPKFMIYANLDKLEQKIVPYDESSFGEKPRVIAFGYRFNSLDNFNYFVINYTNIVINTLSEGSVSLVSSYCEWCEKAPFFVEDILGGHLFCSEECQIKYHNKK